MPVAYNPWNFAEKWGNNCNKNQCKWCGQESRTTTRFVFIFVVGVRAKPLARLKFNNMDKKIGKRSFFDLLPISV